MKSQEDLRGWMSGFLHDRAYALGLHGLALKFWHWGHGGPCNHDRELAGKVR